MVKIQLDKLLNAAQTRDLRDLQVGREKNSLNDRRANLVSLRVLRWQTTESERTLMRLQVESLRRFRQVGEEDETEHCHGERNDAVNDECLYIHGQYKLALW